MLKTILEAIKPYFDRMPRPVQVGAFVIAIALMIYVIVYPNVISGELLVKKGDVIHKFRGTDVEVPYGGHLFVQRTDNRGRWVVPAPKIPKAISLRVNVGSPDAPEWESIMIESSAYVLGGFVSITWNHDDRTFATAELARLESLSSKIAQALDRTITGTAYAGMLRGKGQYPIPVLRPVDNPPLPGPSGSGLGRVDDPPFPRTSTTEFEGGPAPDWKKKDFERLSQINDIVRGVIGKTLAISPDKVGENYPLRLNSELDHIDRIGIVDDLEKSFDLVIPDRHWQGINTVGEMSQYIFDRKNLEERNPKLKKLPPTGSWYEIQKQFEGKDIPVYQIAPPNPKQ